MKRLSIILLSFLVLNAGVAWALESCLHLHDHFDHSGSMSTEPHRGDDLIFSDSHSPDRLDSDPACAYLHVKTDPVIGTPATQVGLFARGAALNESPSLASIAQSETGDLWLRGAFRRFLSFPALRGLSYHLFSRFFESSKLTSMDAMTMGYKVSSNSLLKGLKPGDKIRFALDTRSAR
jgi:hypothetical protein